MLHSGECVIPGIARFQSKLLLRLPFHEEDVRIKDISNPELWEIFEIVLHIVKIESVALF